MPRLSRKPPLWQMLVRVKAAGVGDWDTVIRPEQGLNSNPCLSFWVLSYQELSKELGGRFGIQGWRRGKRGNKRAV